MTAAIEGRLHDLSASRPAGSHLLYLPSGKYLRAIAPGYRELLADVVYLWSIQYYSSYDAGDRYKYLDHVYSNVITELDPRYEDPYLIGALIMTMEAGDLEMGLRLLDKGIAANPSDWLLAFEAGFYCYDTLHDYPRAARYFERAMKVPGVHPLVARLRAEMYDRSGDRRASWKYWLEICQSGSDEYTRQVACRHVHDLKIQIDVEELQSAVNAYAAARGANPPSLEALADAGFVERVPRDSEGSAYLYNRATGKVRTVAHPLLRRSFD